MAALTTIARQEADTIREGIAWLIIWKTGRSWHAEAVWLNTDDDTFELEDLDTARKALEEDPNAVMLNGYYCGHFWEDMSAAEIEAGIRWHYENGYNLLKDSTAFPPEPIERPADLPADLPWYGKATSAEPDPYVYDGYMSIEDYEHMHELMEADRQQESRAAPDTEPEPANSMTLELTIGPEQAAAIVAAVKPVIDKAFDAVVQALRDFSERAAGVIKKAAEVMRRNADNYMDALLYTANTHPKWWHLYKHAKKARTRKKYRRRLMQQLTERLRAAPYTKEVIT